MTMRFSTWLSLGIGFGVLCAAACGGNVSLGTAGGQLAGDGGSTSSGSDGGGQLDCQDAGGCGPTLGSVCSDGSSPSGRCLQKNDGTCAWENPGCPTTPPACFDSGGKLLDAYRSCATAADCVVVEMQTDCCGNMLAAGVNKTSEAEVTKCAADRTAAYPGCGCPATAPSADDGTTDPTFGAAAEVTCRNNKCESTFEGEKCGSHVCTANQTCCGPMPLPDYTCVEGASAPCPISQRKMKKDILYLSEAEKEQLSSELMSFPLATYRYKVEGPDSKPHLGFIIDDVAPSPAVLESGERVDLYGYGTMTVAALQVQAKEIAELKKQMEDLKKECAKKKDVAPRAKPR